MGRKRKNRRRGRQRGDRHRKETSMPGNNPLPTREETQTLNAVKREGWALPVQFQNWSLWFFTHSSYLRALQAWASAKRADRHYKIEADMEPNRTLVEKAAAQAELDLGSSGKGKGRTWSWGNQTQAGRSASLPQHTQTQWKPPVPRPSGMAIPEGEPVHMVM